MKKTRSLQLRLLRLRYALFCFGKTFRVRKIHSPIKDVEDSLKDKNTFTVINDEDKEVVCNVLFTFDSADESRHYIVYTDGSKDDEDNVRVYASRYDPQHEEEMELLPIETDEEWATIQEILEDLQNKIKNGESIDLGDEDDEEDDEEDEVLESLPFAIGKRLSDWSDRLHFPVGAILPYVIGVVLFHLLCANPLSIWGEFVFVLVELLLMRISYDDIECTHVAISMCIVVMGLYMGILMLALDPLMAKLFPNTTRATFEPWLFRGTVIVVSIILILRAVWKKRKRRRAWRKGIG